MKKEHVKDVAKVVCGFMVDIGVSIAAGTAAVLVMGASGSTKGFKKACVALAAAMAGAAVSKALEPTVDEAIDTIDEVGTGIVDCVKLISESATVTEE